MNANGSQMEEKDWLDQNARCFGMLLDGRAQETGLPHRGSAETILLVFNGHHDAVQFVLPKVNGDNVWTCLLDTNDAAVLDNAKFKAKKEYLVTPRSLVAFLLGEAK
jgi:glycogen operon protein